MQTVVFVLVSGISLGTDVFFVVVHLDEAKSAVVPTSSRSRVNLAVVASAATAAFARGAAAGALGRGIASAR